MIFLKILVTWLQIPIVNKVCGGTIITEWHILTAAHCVIDEAGPQGIGVLETTQVNVTVGVHNRNEGGQKIAVAQWIIHDLYFKNSTTIENDIAILKLKEKIQVGPNVAVIDWRDSPSARYEGKEATAIGWGNTENNKPVNTPHSPSQLLHNVRLGTCNSLTC